LQAAEESGAESAMLVTEVPREEVYKYGVVKLRVEDGKELFDGIVEKPSVAEAPSNLNNCTFWLFNDNIFDYAEKDIKRPHTGEFQVTDVANEYATDGHSLAVIRAKGEYLDGGTVEGWLHANNRVLGK
jgi:UTP--glucose-1-phosphate uridylyltransferase